MITLIVLGASAGGLDPLRAFLCAATAEPDVAIIVVTHRPPDRESQLVTLLSNACSLPVQTAVAGQQVQGGVVYVLPPGLAGLLEGRFVAGPGASDTRPARPIDGFMTTVAAEAPGHCVGVVLSGTDHDGTLGLKAIKAAGGLTLVQAPETAEFRSMPTSAMSGGDADQVLPPDAMPAAIRAHLDGAQPAASSELLAEVLETIRVHTGFDFRRYRPGMLHRRLQRHLASNQIADVRQYLDTLGNSPTELDALKNEFLIGVTEFYRDADVWTDLEGVLAPALDAMASTPDALFRVWTAGCATGEESYSIAMLLLERFAASSSRARLQVLGTDIDLRALAVARAGTYGASSLSRVSEERRTKFFVRQDDRWVASKPLRDSIVFAPHDLVLDPPYSKLDLIICRNVLIYFEPALQRRVLELFRFALKPDGILLLGKAESIGSQTEGFAPASRSSRLYRRLSGRASLPADLLFPGPSRRTMLEMKPVAVKTDLEELQVANEEALSLNEELQSSNEELESSKEELQALNEELTTVNARLEDKVREIARVNADLADLLSSTQIATVLLDRDLCLRRFTPSAAEIFHLKAGDEGRPLSDISSRVEDRDFARDLGRVATGEEPLDVEVRHPNGNTYLRRLRPYRRADGSPGGAVVTYLDVTALRTASRRAGELMTVFENSNDAVIIHNLDGEIREWNAGAVRIYGHERDQIVGRNLSELIPPAARAEARRLFDQALEEGRAGPFQAPRLRRDGKVLTASVTLSLLRDHRGQSYAILSTERDITSQLRAEREIYFRRLADLIPALLWVEDVDGRTEFLNQAFVEFTGRETEALLRDGWINAIAPEDRPDYLAAFRKALAARTPYSVDFRYLHKGGGYRWMRCTGVPRNGDDGVFAGYVALAIDVEARRRAENALLDADRRKDEYLATLAHELRNPLAPIRNAVTFLGMKQATDPDMRWATEVIARQTEALARLLDDLLDVARIARGKVTLQKIPVDLAVVADRAVEVCSPSITARRQSLDVDVSTRPLLVEGDLLRLTQVLVNLVDNASKYTEAGGRIGIAIERAGEKARIRVKDSGAGIAAEMLPRVFDMFMQADRTLDRSKGGLGLGLTLVRRLVELHGGSVEARSAGLGHGSEFVVELPLLAAATSEEPHMDATPGESVRVGHRVLIVDDNADAADSMALVLRGRGHDVRTAYSGQQGVAVAAEYRPDVAILDIGLPDRDGYQVAQALRARQSTTRTMLVALTGYGQPEDIVRAQQAGFDRHLVKPADLEELEKLIEAVPRISQV